MAYINDSVLSCFKKQLCELECNPDKYSKVKARFLKNNVIPTIEGYKSVDVVEVVRCKDCTRRVDYEGKIMCNKFGHKFRGDGEWYGLRATTEDHFCSYGERK